MDAGVSQGHLRFHPGDAQGPEPGLRRRSPDCTSVDLPMPGEPASTRAPPSARQAASRRPWMVARSMTRPTRALPGPASRRRDRSHPTPHLLRSRAPGDHHDASSPVGPDVPSLLAGRPTGERTRRFRPTGSRTRSASGSDSNSSGGDIATLSPSIPSATVVAESTRHVAVAHSSNPRGGGPVSAMTPSNPRPSCPLVPSCGRGSTV